MNGNIIELSWIKWKKKIFLHKKKLFTFWYVKLSNLYEKFRVAKSKFFVTPEIVATNICGGKTCELWQISNCNVVKNVHMIYRVFT